MSTIKFHSQEQLSEVFDCRYAKRSPCEGTCPLGVSREACEAAYFYGMEGRPACGTRIAIGDVAVVETRELPEGGGEVIDTEAKAWKTGWRRWCRLESREDCRDDAERAGFDFAAKVNESGWGERPRSSEAGDGWESFCG
jgi:hypothetical protein